MVAIYRLGIGVYNLLVFFASFLNPKAKKWRKAKAKLFDKMEAELKAGEQRVWFHFPSLGEFEQGRTFLEQFKKEWPKKKIVVTFFSPSGYEVRKRYAKADYVFYLPSDTPANAKRFLDLLEPQQAFFIKYDYWYFFFMQLKTRQIPLYMISAIFRPGQVFFTFYGGFFRRMLHCVSHFFVQNEKSRNLLSGVGIGQVTVTGDTRFDRVLEIAQQAQELQLIERFQNRKKTLVAGSTWPEDLEPLCAFHKRYKSWRLIIAPHDITEKSIRETLEKFPGAILYSQLKAREEMLELEGKAKSILIVDNIGMLASLYRYGDICYVGGGFGKGIHNTLEAAVYGRAVLFGPHYKKFQEAVDLVDRVVGFPVKDSAELIGAVEGLMDEDFRMNVNDRARSYVYLSAGATARIISYFKQQNLR